MVVSQYQGKTIDPPKTRRRSGKDTIKNTKKTPSSKHETHSDSVNPSNDGRHISTPYAENRAEILVRQREPEEDNKYVLQAMDMIMFTVQEAIDLERLLKMSEKLSSDTMYVREVMSRLLVQLDKIETVNNRKIIHKKSEGRLFIKEKIQDLIRYSKEVKKTIVNKKDIDSEPKTLASQYINLEQIEERKKQRQESNKNLTLTTISEGSEKEETCDEEFPGSKKPNQKKSKEELQKNELRKEENHSTNIKKIQTSLSSPNLQINSVLEQASPPFILDPEHSTSNVEVEQTYLSPSFALDPNSNIQIVPNSPLYNNLEPGRNSLKFKRVVGPYIIVNQNVLKSAVTTIIEDENSKEPAEDHLVEAKENIEDNNPHGSNLILFPGIALEIRLLIILILTILVEVPILMIICPIL